MIYNQFHDAIDNLRALNLEHRKAMLEYAPQMSMAYFAAEFCTVKADIGRRTGKTEYIRDRATQDDLIIAANRTISRNLFSGLPAQVLTPDDLERKAIGGAIPYFRTIFIDEPEMVLRRTSLRNIYMMLARDNEQTFVMLGS